MQQGADLRGMYLWTLVDNFEWHEAYKHRFGLFSCDMSSPDLERVPRADSVATVKAIHAVVPDTVAEVFSKMELLIDKCHHVMCCDERPLDCNQQMDVQHEEGDDAPVNPEL